MKPTRLLAILAIAMVAGLMVSGCKDPIGLTQDTRTATHWVSGPPEVYTIWANPHTNVGSVSVWNTPDSLYITYKTTGRWWIEKTQTHVALQLKDIPQRYHVPKPDRFEFQNDWHPRVQTCTLAIEKRDGWDVGTYLYIATHSVVVYVDSRGRVTQREEAWAGPYFFEDGAVLCYGPRYIKYTVKDAYKDVDLPPGDDLPVDSVSMSIKKTMFNGTIYTTSGTTPPGDFAAFKVTLWNVPGSTPLPPLYDVYDGDWPGWCLELGTSIYDTAKEYRAKLYSDQDPNLPTHLQSDKYDNLNYLINHKIPGCTAVDVQTAIWYIMGGLTNFGTLPPLAQQMVTEANANGDGWHPGPGQWVGVLAHGKLTGDRSTEDAQLVMLEVDP